MATASPRKPAAGFWITLVLITLLFGYPLSIGPAAWFNTRGLPPPWLTAASKRFYWPIIWLRNNGPAPVDRAIMWYSQLWWPPGKRN